MKNNKDPFDIINKIIFESMKEAMTKLILIYYHYYKTDNDSLQSIYNSLLDFYILNEKDAKKLLEEVIKNLRDNYFYEINENELLKINSVI